MSYDELITTPSGQEIAIKFKNKAGEEHDLTLFHEYEVEGRIVFPREAEVPQDVIESYHKYYQVKDPKGNIWQGQATTIDTIDSLIYLTRDNDLKFTPLRSNTDYFHGKKNYYKKNVEFDDVKPGEMQKTVTKKINQAVIESGEGRNIGMTHEYIKVDYLIGSQDEISKYYDDANDSLKKLGYTARVKTWYSPGKVGKVKPKKRILTVKKGIGKDKIFHDRSEYSIVLPDSITETEDISNLIATTLKQIEPKHAEVGEIIPKVQINNSRNGIDLRYKDEKIGKQLSTNVLTIDIKDPNKVFMHADRHLVYEPLPGKEDEFKRVVNLRK